MREILGDMERWQKAGEKIAVCTVVAVWGSAPRRPGARLAVTASGKMAGSVSGGCVEAAVVEEASGVLETGVPKLVRYQVTDDKAWSVGLACGGAIDVFIEAWSGETCAALQQAVAEERTVVSAVIIDGSGAGSRILLENGRKTAGTLGSEHLDHLAAASTSGRSRRFSSDDVEIFVELHEPSPKLFIVGAVHIAIPLITFASALGFRTWVIDPRKMFATTERFGHADHLINDWPDSALAGIGLDENSYVAILSHDDKIDLPAIETALDSKARYIGVLGSHKTHAARIAKLLDRGVSQEELEKLHAPIGLKLGGRRPEEIAVSVIAEMVQAAYGV